MTNAKWILSPHKQLFAPPAHLANVQGRTDSAVKKRSSSSRYNTASKWLRPHSFSSRYSFRSSWLQFISTLFSSLYCEMWNSLISAVRKSHSLCGIINQISVPLVHSTFHLELFFVTYIHYHFCTAFKMTETVYCPAVRPFLNLVYHKLVVRLRNNATRRKCAVLGLDCV